MFNVSDDKRRRLPRERAVDVVERDTFTLGAECDEFESEEVESEDWCMPASSTSWSLDSSSLLSSDSQPVE